MTRKTFMCLCLLAAGLLAAVPSSAFQLVTSPSGDEVRSLPTIRELEQAVRDLEQEYSNKAAATQPAAPDQETRIPAATARPPFSTQCRVITTVVTFNRVRVADEDGPDMWYTQGYFEDPADHKTYRFQFDDMGATADSNEPRSLCVVVFHPSDRQLNESDIVAIIPTEWVKEQSQQPR